MVSYCIVDSTGYFWMKIGAEPRPSGRLKYAPELKYGCEFFDFSCFSDKCNSLCNYM